MVGGYISVRRSMFNYEKLRLNGRKFAREIKVLRCLHLKCINRLYYSLIVRRHPVWRLTRLINCLLIWQLLAKEIIDILIKAKQGPTKTNNFSLPKCIHRHRQWISCKAYTWNTPDESLHHQPPGEYIYAYRITS